MARKKPRKAQQRPVSLGGVVKEDLPLPFVHYPNHYGTFFAFSKRADSDPFLCECSIAAVSNYIKLSRSVANSDTDQYPADAAQLGGLNLPNSLRSVALSSHSNPSDTFRFREKICHRCNLTPPTMRYCHEMYGVRFIQYFGWYVNQAYLRFGIAPRGTTYLEDTTPDEFIEDIVAIKQSKVSLAEAYRWFREREEYTWQRIRDPSLPELERDYEEIARRQDILRKASREARQAERVLSKKIEDIVRMEFGFRKVGERWVSETLLFQIVRLIFSRRQILRHCRPDWLGGLELDIYLPGARLAFEYQGQQHFHPVEAWGGEESLKALQERDDRKAKICRKEGIRLIAVDYTEPLTVEHIREIMPKSYLVSQNGRGPAT